MYTFTFQMATLKSLVFSNIMDLKGSCDIVELFKKFQSHLSSNDAERELACYFQAPRQLIYGLRFKNNEKPFKTILSISFTWA